MIRLKAKEETKLTQCNKQLEKEMRFDDNLRQWIKDKYDVTIEPPK